MSTWNYRIGTKMMKTVFQENVRVFSIISVYYDKKLKPTSYGEDRPLSDMDSLDDLKNTYNLIKDAINKPIIDLNNFPKIYKIKK